MQINNKLGDYKKLAYLLRADSFNIQEEYN